MTGTLHEDQYTFFTSHSLLLILSNVSDKGYKENQSTRLMFNNIFFESRDKMWKNMEETDRPQMTILRMRIACWIPKTTNAHISICNNYSFYTVSMVARKSLSVT